MTGRAPAPESSAGLPGGLLVTETPDQVEARIERYFQERLDRYRRGRLPWIFQPQAWWARWNRNALRKGARARRDVN
jgi:hypothetical protein